MNMSPFISDMKKEDALKTKIFLTVFLFLVISLTLTFAVAAAEGKGQGTVTYINVSDDSSKRADGSMLVRNHSKGVVLCDDDSAPIHMNAQDCYGTNIIGADGNLIVASGYCDAADKDGDMWWIWWRSEGGKDTWGFMGGTGKFEGIKGGGTTSTLAMYPDGRQVISWEGTWQMK